MDEKQTQADQLRETRNCLIRKVDTRLVDRFEKCDLELEIFKVKRQLAVLKTLLKLRTENICVKKSKIESASRKIEDKRRILVDLRSSVAFIGNWEECLNQSLSKRNEGLEKRKKHLTIVRQETGTDLFRHIFPLDTVTVSNNTSTHTTISDQSSSIEVVDALSEATLTNYCHDRWIFMGRQAETQYRLVHSCTVGDFSDYALLTGWLFRYVINWVVVFCFLKPLKRGEK